MPEQKKNNIIMNFEEMHCSLCRKDVEVTKHHFIICEFPYSWWFSYNWNII